MNPANSLTPAPVELWPFLDAVPTPAWSASPDGSLDFFNRAFQEYAGRSIDQLCGSKWKPVVHRDDIDKFDLWWKDLRGSRESGVIEVRLHRHDGSARWFQVRGLPVRDREGDITAWYLLLTDVEDRKSAEQALQRSQFYLKEGQRLASMGSWALSAAGFDYWSPEMFSIYGMAPGGNAPTVAEYLELIPAEDRGFIRQKIEQMLQDRLEFDFTKRIVRPDGKLRYVRCAGSHLIDGTNFQGLVGTAMDVTEQEEMMQALQSNERNLNLIINTMPAFAWTSRPDGSVEFLNQRWLDYTGLSLEEGRDWGWTKTIHPDDLSKLTDYWQSIISSGEPGEIEARIRRSDGIYRWCLFRASALHDGSGKVVKWYGTTADIDDLKRAEHKLQQSEKELLTTTDAIANPIIVLAPDGKPLYANRVALNESGLSLDEVKRDGFVPRVCHPDDLERGMAERRSQLNEGIPFSVEMRLRKYGEYRWQLVQYNPLKDEMGKLIRWYATATDIDDQKKTEERLRDENVRLDQERVYLEEQIRSEMGFEQIIGNSPALRHVLQMVETVAPNDSTVLLLGETGTGKELIARAIHDLSRRKAKTFVKLNCAAIPTGLLESELFGHEKGAFTGAITQKLGRMELADQGTLFLDEVGDIPVDIQPKLLRALQEREFERLGSTHTRKVNLRLVAATNRNLEKMVADREFRSDLFYRLNVFPIRIPPLRERRGDIPLLVAYFVDKFAKEMQKRIDSVPVATMKALTAWDWPGNIRELENFIERTVILTRGDSLTAPLSELHALASEERPELARTPQGDIARIVEQTIASLKTQRRPPNERVKSQQEEIVRILGECKGRVGGKDGAAVRMGLSRTTLIGRMKRLGINPYDYA